MGKFVSVTLAVAACSSATQGTSSSGAEALAGTGTLSASEILGSISCGETEAAAYRGSPAYGAYSFAGTKGQTVNVALAGSTSAEAEVWLLRSDFTEVTSAGAATKTSLSATLAKTETYYIAFRDKSGASETFDVSLACSGGGGVLDGGAADSAPGDAGAADTGTADTGTADTGTADTGTADTGAADTGATDTGATDTGIVDSGTADTGAVDSGPPDSACASTQSVCGGVCVDESTDPSNCGACGNGCEASQTCNAGACTPPDPFEANSCTGSQMTTAGALSRFAGGASTASLAGFTATTRSRSCNTATGCSAWSAGTAYDALAVTCNQFNPQTSGYSQTTIGFTSSGTLKLAIANGSPVLEGTFATNNVGYGNISLTTSAISGGSLSSYFSASDQNGNPQFLYLWYCDGAFDIGSTSIGQFSPVLTDSCFRADFVGQTEAASNGSYTSYETVLYATF
jgi:hypothetical protein